MIRNNSKRDSVLLFGTHITALGTLRCLRHAGHRVQVATVTLPFIRASRHYKEVGGGQGLLHNDETERLEDWLTQSDLGGRVLFPCSDDWVTAIADLPDELRYDHPSSIPPGAALRRLIDKSNLAHLGQELQIPQPLSWRLSSRTDLPAESEVVYHECFLKPLHSQQFFRRFGVKAFMLSSRVDAVEKLDRCREAGLPVILQRYVLGPPSNHYFVDGFMDRNGRICAMIARRRLRMYPLDFGNSSYMTSVEINEVGPMREHLIKLLEHVKYRGIFSAELKRDERDGELKLIEVNTRAWAYIQFALNCGINVAEMAVRDARGLPIEQIPRAKIGKSMKILPHDFDAARSAVKAGDIGWLTVILQWFKARSDLFCWNDPLPWVVQRYKEVSSFLRNRLSKALGLRAA